jgi:DNA-directed RNA polymerase specialized sigma24 family protein
MANTSPRFQTTLWSEVLLVGKEPASSAGRSALERLCRTYWYPIYGFIRRRGASPEDAQDLTQGFFEHILSSEFFSRANPDAGRFRNFLLGALRNYLGHAAAKRNTQRGGGLKEKISIDASLAEHWLGAELTAENDPTLAFDRSWATSLMARAIAELEAEQSTAGRQETFARLKTFLQRAAEPGEYDGIARELAMTKGAVAASVHRLNRRFGELVRQSVRETVASPDMAEEELKHLFTAIGG